MKKNTLILMAALVATVIMGANCDNAESISSVVPETLEIETAETTSLNR